VKMVDLSIVASVYTLFHAAKSGASWLYRGGGKLLNTFKSLFNGRSVIFLGPSQNGKTALALYLTTGKPYRLKKGNVEEPDPTSRVVKHFFAKTAKVSDEILEIKFDMAGDRVFMESDWIEVIKDLQPEGIVYIVDGRKLSNDKFDDFLDKTLSDINSYVLSAYGNNIVNLKALHIFANFGDQWSDDSERVQNMYKFEFDVKTMILREKAAKIDVAVTRTHLSPESRFSSWPEAEAALKKFASAL